MQQKHDRDMERANAVGKITLTDLLHTGSLQTFSLYETYLWIIIKQRAIKWGLLVSDFKIATTASMSDIIFLNFTAYHIEQYWKMEEDMVWQQRWSEVGMDKERERKGSKWQKEKDIF